MKNILKILFANSVLANILMLMIIFAGILGVFSMVREKFPRFSVDIINVSVSYPGADPEEVEEGICLKLEEALSGLEGVKKMTTTAMEGAGSALIECEESADLIKVKDDVKTLVDAIVTFPRDAERPVVQEIKFRGEVVSIAVWGDLPERQLKEAARVIENELLQIDSISQVSTSGIRDYEISVEVPEENLRRFDLTFDDISRAISQNGLNLPSGFIKTSTEELRIRAVGRRYTAKDYGNIPIITSDDGTLITLGQIARIDDTFDDDATVYAFFNGKPSVSINIYKTESEDSIVISKAVDKYLEKKRAQLPSTIHLTKFRDYSRMITGRLNILVTNGQIGLILVFLSLWFFLDIRLSFWVSMGIPISLAGGLALMSMLGYSINMLSLFGLIMVLGLIVDDAIVVGESIYSRRAGGDGCFDAAVNGTSEVALPVIAAVMTTIIAFIPLFFIGGVMGKFIRQIPVPVIAALSVSLIEGLFILPVHLRHLPSAAAIPKWKIVAYTRKFRSFLSGGLEHVVQNIYGPFMDRALQWRYLVTTLAFSVFIIIGTLAATGFIRFIFLPESDSDFIRAKVELPEGTPIADTKAIAERVMAAWQLVEEQNRDNIPEGEDLTVAVFTLLGSSITFEEKGGRPNKMEVTVELLPSESRNIHYKTLVSAWQKAVGEIYGAVSTDFGTFRKGPGGDPISMELMGDDLDTLLVASDELKRKLNSFDGIYDVQSDYRQGKREFIISARPEAYHHGFSLSDIARHVQGGFYGTESLRIQRGRDDVKVKVRYPKSGGRNSIEYFKKLKVRTASGHMIPLLSIADIRMIDGQSTINRKNRKRLIVVRANVDDSKTNARQVVTSIERNFLPKLLSKYSITYAPGGQQQETFESLSSLFIGFPLALFGIYFIIASIFRSYIQPMVIMVTIPFGLIGGIIGHVICGLPITIMSLFGMVALAGIVVNDAIVLIEGINMRLSEGASLMEALREGGKRRFRPIMLTTMTTFFGLMPLILEKSMQAQFLIPMAVSIAFGVLFATVLTLILLPCLMAILNDLRRIVYRILHSRWPEREELEPRARNSSAI